MLGWAAPAGAGLLAAVVVWVALDPSRLRRSAYSLLLAHLWALSIAAGALLWLALGHVIGARWQVALHRLTELLTVPLPWLGLGATWFLVPVALRSSLLYRWVDATASRGEVPARSVYLDPWGFAVRGAVYLLVWNGCAHYFRSRSKLQARSPHADFTSELRRAGAPILVGMTLTLTFAAIDWIMTLNQAWSSSIFGLYFSLGSGMAALAALVLLTVALGSDERLRPLVTRRHYHDLGRSLYTFVMLWAYVAFCQALLMWYAGLPQEMEWLQGRLTGPWKLVSALLACTHCLVPLFGLMPRAAKEQPRILGFWAAWLLVAHYIDLYWLIMPEAARSGPPIPIVEVACLGGLAGLFVASVARAARRTDLAPVAEPRLAAEESVEQA